MKMVQCPKCDFEQPQDAYCASCGVNMSKFKPSKKPAWQKLLANWMFQLGVLIVIVIVLVVNDKVTHPTNPVTTYNQVAKKVDTFEAAPEKPKQKRRVRKPRAKKQEREAHNSNRSATVDLDTTKAAPEDGNTILKPNKRKSLMGPMRRVRLVFYEITLQTLEELAAASKDYSNEGYSSTGVLPKKIFNKIISETPFSRKNIKALRENKTRRLLIGKTLPTNERKMGLYLEITRTNLESDTNMNVDIKVSHLFKFQQEEPSAIFTADLAMNPNSVGFISGFLPKNLELSSEEKDFYGNINLLNKMFSPSYVDGSMEVLVVIEPRR